MEPTALAVADCQEAGQALTTMSDHLRPPVINYTAESQGEYSGADPSETTSAKPDLCICGNWEFDAELLQVCFGPFPSTLPELDLDTPEYRCLLLPASTSHCSLEEELQCDALLASHPLLPHLQELLHWNPESPLVHSPDLAKGLCSGVPEADHLLLTAVNMLGRSDASRSNDYIEQVDSDCRTSACEISTFCRMLLESPQGKENKNSPTTLKVRLSTVEHMQPE